LTVPAPPGFFIFQEVVFQQTLASQSKIWKKKRRRKTWLLLLILLLMLCGAAYAAVTMFGFNPWMTRYAEGMDAPILLPSWYSDIGESFSQPLILDGGEFGQDEPVVIAAGGGGLYGWVCPPVNAAADYWAASGGK